MPPSLSLGDTAPSRHLEWKRSEPKIGAVLVTYNPHIGSLTALLDRLLPQVDLIVLVDNGSANADEILALAQELGIQTIANQVNRGIATAQNRGITAVLECGCDLVVLSDQDSLPEPKMVSKLYDCLIDAAAVANSGKGAPVAAVGPVPIDTRANQSEDEAHDPSSALVYSFTKWGPKRRNIPSSEQTKDVPFILASGSLIPAQVLRHVGPMNESLFIDHVDLAWCMRAVAMGYRILVCGDARLEHSLGEEQLELPTGRKIHVQSPTRNYYMVRNTLFLTNASFMPWRWKAGYMSYLAKYTGFYALAGIVQPKRWGELAAGFRDGIRGRGGPRG